MTIELNGRGSDVSECDVERGDGEVSVNRTERGLIHVVVLDGDGEGVGDEGGVGIRRLSVEMGRKLERVSDEKSTRRARPRRR